MGRYRQTRMHNLLSLGRTLIASVAGSTTLMLAACGGDGGGAPGPATTKADGEVVVSMADNRFVPHEITVSAGRSITVVARNDGAAVHNLLVTVDGRQSGTDLMVGPGESSTFEVTFPKAGTYEFVCGLHLPDMAGTFTAR